jgi:hydroxymethylbilane synthase
LQSALIRIGTRGSPLALAQAEEVRRRLLAAHGLPAEAVLIVPIRTTGDRITDRPLADAGGKGLFTKEIDEALIAGTIDLAVHSAKDLPTRLAEGIAIAACLPRADVRDAFISRTAKALSELPQGAVLGTSSLRRQAMALRLRPDLKIVNLRGNVETRLRRIEEGAADATLLAAAGLTRLGLLFNAASLIEPDDWLPAVGQGIIVITTRSGDSATASRLAVIDDRDSSVALATERAFLDVLDGSCRTPIGGLARLVDGQAARSEAATKQIWFRGIIVAPDGTRAHATERRGPLADLAALGADAGAELRRRGGPDFFAGG